MFVINILDNRRVRQCFTKNRACCSCFVQRCYWKASMQLVFVWLEVTEWGTLGALRWKKEKKSKQVILRPKVHQSGHCRNFLWQCGTKTCSPLPAAADWWLANAAMSRIAIQAKQWMRKGLQEWVSKEHEGKRKWASDACDERRVRWKCKTRAEMPCGVSLWNICEHHGAYN